MALAVLAIPAVGFLLHWSIDGARQAADEIHMWVIYGLAATGIVFATIFLWNLLWSPYRVERDRRKSLEAEVSKLQERITPKVRLALKPWAAEIDIGSSVTTMGGQIQTIFTMEDYAVRIVCRNLTSETLSGVRAFLIGAQRIDPDGAAEDLLIRDEIELPWSIKAEPPQDGEQLRPDSEREIFVLTVRPGGVMTPYLERKALNAIPAKYHQMFFGPHRFRLRVGVYAMSGGPAFIEFDVRNNNPADQQKRPDMGLVDLEVRPA